MRRTIFIPVRNIDKMRRGCPLSDEDRRPWLEKLHDRIERSLASGQNAVLACSALKEKYRRHLRVNAEVKFVYLHGERALIADQLRHRRGHFMNAALLETQLPISKNRGRRKI